MEFYFYSNITHNDINNQYKKIQLGFNIICNTAHRLGKIGTIL